MTSPMLDDFLAQSEAHARITLAVNETLGAWHGLNWLELRLLLGLQRAGWRGLALLETASLMGCSASAVLRLVLPLEKTGLIERRAARLLLRPAGDRLAREAAASAAHALQRMRLAPAVLPAPEAAAPQAQEALP